PLTSNRTAAGIAAGSIIDALNVGAPCLHVTGQVAASNAETGRGYIHYCKDQLGMLRSISKEAHRIRRPEQAPAIFRQAIIEAMTPPAGPVSVEIPIDFQASLITVPSILTASRQPEFPRGPELAVAVERLLHAK